MKRPTWIALLLAAGPIAIAIAFFASSRGNAGDSRVRRELEGRLRGDRWAPQPGPIPAPERPTLWLAREEPDWSAPEVRAALIAELCALDELVTRGTWTRAREDRERSSELSIAQVLARLGAIAAEREAHSTPLPLVVPLLLEERLLEPAICAPLWRLYRTAIRDELARTDATHAVRLRALLERAPRAEAEELVLELWDGAADTWWALPWTAEIVRAVGGSASLERILQTLPALDSADRLLAWTATSRVLAEREGTLDAHRVALAAAAERAVDAALAKRLPDAFVVEALRLAVELSGRQPLALIDERLRDAPPGTPLRVQLERLRLRRF